MEYFNRRLVQNKLYNIPFFLFVMGCEQSQIKSNVPQQHHLIEKNHLKNHKLQDTHSKQEDIENRTQSVFYHAKKNQKPKEPLKEKQKENDKGTLEKKTALETQNCGKQQKKLIEAPMSDCTNLEKAVSVLQSEKFNVNNLQKPINVKFDSKIEKESMVVQFSKTIEIEEIQKKQFKEEGHRVKDFINIQEFSVRNEAKVEVEQKGDFASKIKVKSVRQIKEGTLKLIKVEQKSNFTFQHWEINGEEQQLSKMERLQRVNQMQIQREQVDRYLNSVWDYEKELLSNIIAKLQLQQYKKIEQPITIIK